MIKYRFSNARSTGVNARAALAVAIAATLPAFSASGFDINKENNSDPLNSGISWAGGVVPGSEDVAVWNSTVTGVNAPVLGASLSWKGIRIADPGGLVTIGGTTPTAGTSLTLGTGGIDMSAATQNLVISSPTTILAGPAQTWTVAVNRNLRLGTNGGGAANANLDGADGTVVTIAGGGIVDANQGGSGGFADAGGFAGFNGKWIVEAGATLRGLRNGATAWGTNTSADAITLKGGTLAVGGIAGAVGNWTWTTPITLAPTTVSTIDNQNVSGANRTLKLNGAISGGGDLTFSSTGVGTMSQDTGFILTGANTNSGKVTINAGAFLRVGGTAANDVATAAGTTGTLGDGSATNDVINDGTLTFSRSNAHTVANDISGTGSVRIGATGITGSAGQILTLSGNSTYTGPTTLNTGRLNLTGTLTSAITVNTGTTISGTGSTTDILTLSGGSTLALAGGATNDGLSAFGVSINGPVTVAFDSAPIAATVYEVLSYGAGMAFGGENLSIPHRGTLLEDVANRKVLFTAGESGVRTWKGGDGTWESAGQLMNWVEGDQKFYNGDSAVFGAIAADTIITLSGRIAPQTVTVNNAANVYTLVGNANVNDITGTASLVKNGEGTLAIAAQQTYTGATIVNGGVLDLTGGGGAVGTIRGTVTVNNGAMLRVSVNDGTGYNTNDTRVSVINLNGGTLFVNTTANQTLGSGVINLKGGTITGIEGSNLDLFANGSAINTLASDTTSTISIPTMNLRQNDTVFHVEDGAAAVDLLITARLGDGSAGNHNLVKTGAGTMQLTGNNTFGAANLANQANINIFGGVIDIASGGLFRTAAGGEDFNGNAVITIHESGTLRLRSFAYNGEGGTGGLADRRERRVLNGGTIEVLGTTHTSGNDFTVTASGGTFRYEPEVASDTLTLAGNNLTNIQLDGQLTYDAVGNIAVSEVMDGAGGVTKTGEGTLALIATNTYSGPTAVTDGLLLVSGSIEGSAVTVNGGTLGGFGTVGTTTVSTNGTLAPGDGLGMLSVAGPLTLGGNAKFEIDKTGLALSSDLASASGLLTLGGTLVVIATGDSLMPGDTFDLFDAPSFAGSFASVSLPTLSNPSHFWDTSDLGVDGTITVVPEPGSVGLLATGLGLLLSRRRRRS